MASINKKTRLADLIHHRLRVTILDGRAFTGQILAFDKHLNLVLADTEESRLPKKAYHELLKTKAQAPPSVQHEKRFLGLVILRGEQVVNVTVVSGPTADVKKRLRQMTPGKGTAKPLKVFAGGAPGGVSKPSLKGPRR